MKEKTICCGSAHCQGGHRWLDPGQVTERLDVINCGAQPDRTPEQLKAANATLKQTIIKLHEKCEKQNNPEAGQ